MVQWLMSENLEKSLEAIPIYYNYSDFEVCQIIMQL